MPLCYIFTNLKDSEISPDLEENLEECISKLMNKPKERITVMLNTGIRMRFGGKKQPGMVCNIHSIAVFDEKRNPGYFPQLFDVLTSATKLPASSITIELTDLPAHMALNGAALS
uniref:D-dopachrome decarboxylase n=1 Tax=Ruditapes philippinarum TaxID=129788 RepID=A0A2S0SKF4_RUDPH|nr:macrophage migration inhibitory factor 2 [Ruditapes philippinarum]